MKGNNTLQLNEETLIAAVQMYLDSQMVEASRIEVKSVKQTVPTGYTATFTVEVGEPEKGGAK